MDRTHGETRDCRGCRFWSEMLAQSQGATIVALCLSRNGERNGKFTNGRQTCGAWASGHLGAIDEPGSNGTEYQNEEPQNDNG